MDILTQAEQFVARLSEAELAMFREWFYKFDNQIWDEKLESDIESGKLDRISSGALKDFISGHTKVI